MKRIVLFVCLAMAVAKGYGQDDSTKNRLLDNKLSQEVLRNITRRQKSDTVKSIKSEEPFLPYTGKIIRNITIRHIGFERSIYDSTRSFKSSMTQIANSLHSDTRESTIRDNLFIRKNKPLNPYLLADNERYLRDLDFILDSKILVYPVHGSPDSVDVEVRTRDIFSLGVTGRVHGIDEVTVGLYDANLLGMGQRLQVDVAFEVDRQPFTGFDLLYRKSSIGGSLVNATLGYTQIDNGRSLGEENEFAYFLRLDRPLVSPYSRLAGGLEISQNKSVNVYRTADSLFRQYRYNMQDVWVGYNFGIHSRTRNRNRHFVALRYFRQHYSQQPVQPESRALSIYNDQRSLLGEVTFYRQNFYKTRYLYGFGRTEDVPYGQTVSLTSGWMNELGHDRLYAGASIVKGIVRESGTFYTAEAGVGTFFDHSSANDAFVFANLLHYNKLLQFTRFKIRQMTRVGYAKAFNNQLRELLSLNNELTGFRADSLYGYQRVFLRTETTLFTNWSLIGFRFAPFLSLENAWLKQKDTNGLGDFYWGTTGGIRIRNENLIFGTIEFRAFYFPNPPEGFDPLSFKITTNVRLKYSGSFVRPPSLVQYN